MKRKHSIVILCVMCVSMMGIGAALFSQTKNGATEANGHGIVRNTDLKWVPIMKNCELAAVSGDSNAEGASYVLRIRCANGTKIPAHWHPFDENLTVLTGIFQVGMGETFDASKLQNLGPGSFTSIPKEMRHFAMCKGTSIVQVHGVGPFKINWVNPAEVQPPDAKK